MASLAGKKMRVPRNYKGCDLADLVNPDNCGCCHLYIVTCDFPCPAFMQLPHLPPHLPILLENPLASVSLSSLCPTEERFRMNAAFLTLSPPDLFVQVMAISRATGRHWECFSVIGRGTDFRDKTKVLVNAFFLSFFLGGDDRIRRMGDRV